jgi:hypothetical protein
MRVAAPPPAPFDAPPGSPLILRDGSVATVSAAGPADRDEIRRFFDLNPVIVLPGGQGCRIVDARIKVGPRTAARVAGGLIDQPAPSDRLVLSGVEGPALSGVEGPA